MQPFGQVGCFRCVQKKYARIITGKINPNLKIKWQISI